MARKIKFALELKGGYQARSNVDEIREHFDAEKIIAQFCDGRLETWLGDHFQSELAEKVGKIGKDDPDLLSKLCEVLGVDLAADVSLDSQAIAERQSKLQRLSQYTDDQQLLDMADKAAFSQEDLQRLIASGEGKILLCGGRFVIPLAEKNRHYYGVGKAVAVIESEAVVDFLSLGICFDNVAFDEDYELLRKLPQKGSSQTQAGGDDTNFLKAKYREAIQKGNIPAITRVGNSFMETREYYKAKECYMQAASAGDGEAMYKLGLLYSAYNGVGLNKAKAFEWFQKSADSGYSLGMRSLAQCYEKGDGVERDPESAGKWYYRAAEAETGVAKPAEAETKVVKSAESTGAMPRESSAETVKGNSFMGTRQYQKAWECYLRAADVGDCEAMNQLGIIYSRPNGIGVSRLKALEWFKKSAEGGYARGMYNLAQCYEKSGENDLANEWYAKAAAAGAERGRVSLKNGFA